MILPNREKCFGSVCIYNVILEIPRHENVIPLAILHTSIHSERVISYVFQWIIGRS